MFIAVMLLGDALWYKLETSAVGRPTLLASRLLAQAAARQLSSAAAPSVGRLNHVAIAVPNLQEAAQRYKDVLNVKVRFQSRSTATAWVAARAG